MTERVDILFPVLNRLEFTAISLDSVSRNTQSALVGKLIIVDGGSVDGAYEYVKKRSDHLPFPCEIMRIDEKHVVSAMLEGLRRSHTTIIAKIDNDMVMPPDWLEAGVDVMGRHQELWALGMHSLFGRRECVGNRTYESSSHVGGVGLFRREAWDGLVPTVAPYFGWTEHQHRSPWKKGWIVPAIKAFPMDGLPFEPYIGLSKTYIKNGWQRDNGVYDEKERDLWSQRFPSENVDTLNEEMRRLLIDHDAHNIGSEEPDACRFI